MSESEKIRRQVLGTLLMNAMWRWETLVTVLVTVILAVSVGDFSLLGTTMPAWVWLILGAAAQGALVASALTDPEESQEVIAREFERQYDLTRVRNRNSRERLQTALEYRRKMLQLVKRHQGSMRTSLRQTVEDINDWIGHMHDLAQHIDNFENNDIVSRDLKEVPQKIERTRARIPNESDPRLQADLERQLKLLEQQKLNLEATKNSVKRAEIQLESTLSSLGTVYAQMSLLGTKEVDSSRAQRLRLEIQDEVASLQDTIDAMDEVQMQGLRLS